MNIIGIIASQRKEGNTTFIVNKILEGAKKQGAKTNTFSFSNLDIKPCQGCWACHKGDQGCVVKDDMQKIYNALVHADAIVLGLPIYMGQMSAQGKIFTDRLFARFSPRFSPFFKENAVKQKLILSFNQGNPDAGLFKSYIDYTKHIFEVLEFDVKEVPVVTGLRNGPAHERDDLRTSLMDFGSALVLEEYQK
ncbi:MAG: flavodoxin family protein [Clostridium sp.]|jgi:multimeric flavodoxin WrbA|uniref:flavodoxin family protein n=1 Tax=Clostridium sp. TaxID=1506 RepID=UPI0025BAC2DC|nr:flavodoxin family protein [Clostridium sp.]MCH3965130.1 flavodoxin family protein [Clostridium sp.]MCI1714351.1 flavodoxin family protein [Clostridium sp.]MCI1798613.1 flavodoxin family protein [Clostridium sp.]MCI1812656.1 flavodoxin family protein [Clostridium sp.]MCI1869422.1 flavodoxin family protein [Clostridium sp.]